MGRVLQNQGVATKMAFFQVPTTNLAYVSASVLQERSFKNAKYIDAVQRNSLLASCLHFFKSIVGYYLKRQGFDI